MGTALGYPMWMSLNGAEAMAGSTVSASDALLITAAGPLVTVTQGLVSYAAVCRFASGRAYAFLFAAWFMRLAATVASMSRPNDEARLSLALLGGKWWLHGMVVASLFVLTWSAARRLKIDWRTNLILYAIGTVTTVLIVFGDRWLF